LGRSGWKTCIFQLEVAEKCAFISWKWLKNVHFLGRSGWKTCIFQVEVAEQGRMGLVALHDRVQTTTTTSDGKIFTGNKVQRHGCYQPTAMGNTPYGHSILM
jgi:hypothetical protein